MADMADMSSYSESPADPAASWANQSQLISYGYLGHNLTDSEAVHEEFSENFSRHLAGLNRTLPTNVSLEIQLLCGSAPDWEEIHAYR